MKRTIGITVLIIVGIGVHLAGFLLINVSSREVVEPQPSLAFLGYGIRGGGQEIALLEEKALMEDSEPMLLPTQWNAAVSADKLRDRATGAGVLFKPFPPSLSLAKVESPSMPGIQARTVQTPAEALNLWRSWMMTSFQPEPIATVPLDPRKAVIEVRVAANSEVLQVEAVNWSDFPVEAGEMWIPAQFTGKVDVTGLSTGLLQTEGSGNPELNAYFVRKLTTHPPFASLPPGYYTITVSP